MTRFPARMLLLALALASGLVAAQSQRDTERKLRQVRGEIKQATQQKAVIGDKRDDASQALKAADEQVSASTRALAQTQAAIGQEQGNLATLEQQRAALAGKLAGQKAVLARLVRQAYMAGSDAPLKVLLSQDRVAEAQRALTSYSLLQRDRSTRIRAISADLRQLDSVQAAIKARQQALANAHATLQTRLGALQRDRSSRAVLVAQLDTQYQQTADHAQQLGRNAKALESLLANLRAAAARAEQQRKLAEERARRAEAAEAARQAQEHARAVRAAKARGEAPPPEPVAKPPRAVATAPALHVGGLGWPVSGSLEQGFGGDSSGLLIAAPAGTPVRAVADGQVVFAQWMNGYGFLTIVDHGNGYMSLYAHSDALLKDVGAAVHKGDAVASVGTSGGLSRPAVYFELRRNGQPVNPAVWLQAR